MDLSQDARVVAAVDAAWCWGELVHREEVGSTQDEALVRLREGTRPGLIVVADAQRTGRGRLGRPWRDRVTGVRGPSNLAVTATLPAPEHQVGLVPLVVGVAVAETYTASEVRPRLKWPNDVLLGGRKAAGILVEHHTVGQDPVLLIGCGLNLDWRGVERDDEARAWTSLAEEAGTDIDRGEVLAGLLSHLAEGLERVDRDPAEVLRRYREWCGTLGEPVRVERPGRAPLRGEAVDLDEHGRLIVRTASGRERVDVGDVIHVRAETNTST